MAPQTTDRARAAVARRAQPDGQPPDRAAVTLKQRISNMESAFKLAMPRGAEAAQLVRDALTCLSRNPKLEHCEASSVLGGLMTCAQLGLRPGVLGHAWLLPFWDSKARQFKAQLVIGYQGYAELAHRTGRIQSLIARPVHATDEFHVDYGLADSLVHKPNLFGDRGEVIAYYAIIKYTTGGHAFHVMSRADVERHRDRFAMARDKQRNVIGPWVDNFDSMALKTVYLQLQKWAPKSTELTRALAADGSVREDLDVGALDVMPPSYDIEGEVVSDTADGSDADPAVSPLEPEPATADPAPAHPRPITKPQQTKMHATFGELGLSGDGRRDDRLAVLASVTDRKIGSSSDLSQDEARIAIDTLDGIVKTGGEDGQLVLADLITAGREVQTRGAE